MEDRTREQLEWEARFRPRAAVAAVLAAALTMGATIYNVAIYGDVPRASVVDALARVAEPGPLGRLPSLHIPLYQWFADHFGPLLTASLVGAAGHVATAGALTFLAFATGARRKEFPRVGIYVAFVGGVLLALGTIIVAFGRDALVEDFLAGPKTVDEFSGASQPALLTAAQMIELVGRFALASAFILICLNAMRAGLLTRFLGILGIIAGVLLILPIGSPLPVVQTVWLLALAVLFANRWPGGQPKAWETGTEVPWPTNAELREARDRAREGQAPAGGETPAPEPGPKAGRPSPATSARKKRKRRG